MNINIGVILSMLVVMFALGAAVLMGNADVSSPALAAQEIQQGAPGAATSTIIFNQVVSVLLGILVTAIVTGVGGAVFVWFRDYLDERKKSDWEPGPNAGWKRRGAKPQGLNRDELFQLAMLNMMTQNGQRNMPRITTQRDAQDDYSEF